MRSVISELARGRDVATVLANCPANVQEQFKQMAADMTKVLKALEEGKSLAKAMADSAFEVQFLFRLSTTRPETPRGLTDTGRQLVRAMGGDLLSRLDRALNTHSAWSTAPARRYTRAEDQTPLPIRQAYMTNVLERLEQGDSMYAIRPELPMDVGLLFSARSRDRGLNDAGRKLVRSMGGAALEARFDRALKTRSAWTQVPSEQPAQPRPARQARRADNSRPRKSSRTEERAAQTSAAAGTGRTIPAHPPRNQRQMLVAASREFQKVNASLADMARAAGTTEQVLRPLFTEDGPTEKGWALLAQDPSMQAAVAFNVGTGMEARAAAQSFPAQHSQGAHPGSPQQEASSSVGIPGSDWSGWHMPAFEPSAGQAQGEHTDSAYLGIGSLDMAHFPAPTYHAPSPYSEVLGPARSPQPEPVDSAYSGLGSLSEGRFDLNTPYDDVTGPAWSPQPSTPQGPSFAAESSSAAWFDLNAQPHDAWGHASPSRGAQSPVQAPTASGFHAEVTDLDNYPSPEQQRPLRRELGPDTWLSDRDIFDYTHVIIQRIAEELGAGGYDAITRQINFADPQQVNLLTHGTPEQQAAVRSNFTAPVALVPLHRATRGGLGDHWSLLAVFPDAQMAFHFDSLGYQNSEQSALARQATAAMGVSAQPFAGDMAKQQDGHSCGDHVLAGIEALTRQIMQGDYSMNLSAIEPNRQAIVEGLARYDEFAAQVHAGQAQPQPHPMQATARRRRRG